MKIYQCECLDEDCHTYISTEEYEELKYSGLDGYITLHAHVPVGCTILAKTKTLYLRTQAPE